jgi:hypothetical protein
MSARSAHGEALPRGAEVVIVRDEGGIAYVETFKELLESEQAPSRQV